MTHAEHPNGDLLGGYRPGVGRSWLAWYFGMLDGSAAEQHEAFASERAARKWLAAKVQNDADIEGPKLSWENRYEDGARLLVLAAEDSQSPHPSSD